MYRAVSPDAVLDDDWSDWCLAGVYLDEGRIAIMLIVLNPCVPFLHPFDHRVDRTAFSRGKWVEICYGWNRFDMFLSSMDFLGHLRGFLLKRGF